MAQVVVQDLSFTYPGAAIPALRRVSLEIEQGQFVVLFGKTGCGKTTLLRHLKPALVPHGARQGSVYFEGKVLQDIDAHRAASAIGFMMQNPEAQLVTDKVWHELAFGLENLGVHQQAMRMRVAEMASYFGMQPWFEADVAELSGGQKQLLALASIMVMRPQLLILDEPTSQLDPISAAEFLSTVRKINEEFGTTVVLSEHRLEEVYAAADSVLAMDAGTVVVQGPPWEVAQQLLDAGNELALCLPTPARIAWQVEQAVGQANLGQANLEQELEQAADPCSTLPLSVREGRRWLSKQGQNAPQAIHGGGQNSFAGQTDSLVSPAPASTSSTPTSRQSAAYAIEVKDLWLRYEREAPDVLKGTTLAIPEQSIFALVGANGVGKSSLLRALCGVQKPLRGSIKLLGKKLEQRKRSDLFAGTIALLPQDPTALFVKKTVHEELAEMLPAEEAAEQQAPQLERVAALCQVEHLFQAHPLDLSGGEAQRVALAKVLIRAPRILLLDEPTKGIDATFKRTFAGILSQLQKQGCTIVLASHDLEFCARYANELALLFNGSVAAQGAPQDFFTQASYYTTAANRLCRGTVMGAAGVVTEEDVIALCKKLATI